MDEPISKPNRATEDQVVLRDKPYAARRLCACVRKIENLVSAGELAFIKVGGSVRFLDKDLDAFIERNRRPALSEIVTASTARRSRRVASAR